MNVQESTDIILLVYLEQAMKIYKSLSCLYCCLIQMCLVDENIFLVLNEMKYIYHLALKIHLKLYSSAVYLHNTDSLNL